MARQRMRRYFRHGLLPQLIAFEACLRLGGITRAAEELALAQPTVSGLIARLAETVGAPVLIARGGRIHVTEAGRDVAALCDEMLGALQRFDQRRAARTSLMLARLNPFGSTATTRDGITPGNRIPARGHAPAAEGAGPSRGAGE